MALNGGHLSPEESERFYSVWMRLLKWTNDVSNVVPAFPLPSRTHPIAPELAVRVRDALWARGELLDRFVSENPMDLGRDDLGLAASWTHRVSGTFCVIKHLARCSVFLQTSGGAKAFQVRGLTQPISDFIPYPPTFVETTLLPFEDGIVFDGLLLSRPISFGPGARRMFNQGYAEARATGAVYRRLPPSISSGDKKVRADRW
jgi:hypothetical protein